MGQTLPFYAFFLPQTNLFFDTQCHKKHDGMDRMSEKTAYLLKFIFFFAMIFRHFKRLQVFHHCSPYQEAVE